MYRKCIVGIAVLFFFFIKSASAFEGVKKVWVSASQWPNSKTQETFAKDAVRLYGAQNGTEEQKALAIYYYSLRVMGHGGDILQGPYGKEQPVWDYWMIFHCYTKALCEWWGWYIIDLWKAYNNNWSFDPTTVVARKVGLNAKGENPPVPNAGTHVETALRYKDTDGIFRWHLFDGHLGFFCHPRGSNRVATPEEIHAEYPTILTNPYNPPHPFFIRATVHGNPETDSSFRRYLGNTYPFLYSRSQRRTKYSTDFDLRKGESLRRQWYDDGKPVVAAKYKNQAIQVNVDGYSNYAYPSGVPKDPYNFKTIQPYIKNYPGLGLSKPFGNAYSIYTPELANDKYKQGAVSFSGLSSRIGTIPLCAATKGKEGNVVYQIRSIYPFSESFITGAYYIKSSGRIAIDFSLDSGKTWVTVLNTTTVRSTPVNFNIDIGKARWNAGLASPYNMPDRNSQYLDASNPTEFAKVTFLGYQYLVRIRILSNVNLSQVGLASLTFKNTHQCNIGMLPTLLPGTNTIKVEGFELTPGCTLKVEYSWMENGVTKTRTENITSLPYVFDIYVAETDALKVKCLYCTMTVI